MSDLKQNESQWKNIYVFGGAAAILSWIAIAADIVSGSSTGGHLSVLPQTAIERFAQFQQSVFNR